MAQEPDEIKDALQRFFVLHALRAQAQGTVVHPDYFAGERPRRFLSDVCARLAARGKVRIFQLVIREEVVATRIGFLVGDTLYLYYSGYDPKWAKYGVMTTALVETIKYAIGQGFATIDLSTGKDGSKTRWGPRELALAQVVQVSPTTLSKLAWRGFRRVKTGQPLPRWIGRFVRQRTHDWK